jgi:hypothetical protein
VFPVRYELNLYILFRRYIVSKGLMHVFGSILLYLFVGNLFIQRMA